ncbi:MAG: glycosyltransferase [Actinobacteria bacterium]|nr:glycosyltransferase [Actinomycetota bacterium]
MRVLFLQQQPCVRAMKLAVGLRHELPDLELGFAYQGKTLTEWYGSGDELFDRWWDLGDDARAALPAVLAEYEPDLIHSHNLPDTLTVLAQELANGTPIVHDVHDLQSLRSTPYENGFAQPADSRMLERRAIEESAAVVTVSDELFAELRGRYRLPEHTLVFPNYALRRDVPPLPAFTEDRGGRPPKLVYQGTLSTNGGHYDLREIFRAVVAEGVSLDVYPSRPAPEYRELAERVPGLTVHDTVDPSTLLRLLPRYDYGWAGFNEAANKPHIDTALPNKLFEYLAAGLPVLTLNHRALKRFVRERGLGIALDSPADLLGELSRRDIGKLRRRVSATRHEFTVEANAGGPVALYQRLLEQPEEPAARLSLSRTPSG